MKNLSAYIDHTLLKVDATNEQILKLCEEAKQHHFAAVCVNPTWVKTCVDFLKGSDVKVCTVVGFPLGATTSEAKAFEAKNAVDNGAKEIDMVINIAAVKAGDKEAVENDIRAVMQAVGNQGIVKVIIETCLLTDEEKIFATEAVIHAGAHFVKTSTGFSTGGATIEDVRLMKQIVGNQIQIKAAGGVRTQSDALAMIEAGANRIGTSGGIAIVSGKTHKEGY